MNILNIRKDKTILKIDIIFVFIVLFSHKESMLCKYAEAIFVKISENIVLFVLFLKCWARFSFS